jgi:Rrf2 family protein
MLSLSHTVGYAVLALSCIASWKGQRVFSGQIQKCTGVPMPYLRKILFLLARTGLIRARRGRRGGFILTRPPEAITLLDAARAISNDEPVPNCLLGLPGCSDATPCPCRKFWQPERARIIAQLESVTIAEAAGCVVAARWGKLCECAPPEPVERLEVKRGRHPTRRHKDSPAQP